MDSTHGHFVTRVRSDTSAERSSLIGQKAAACLTNSVRCVSQDLRADERMPPEDLAGDHEYASRKEGLSASRKHADVDLPLPVL
jgi:hypothetical protein